MKPKVFTKKFTESHIYYQGANRHSEQIDEQINAYLEQHPQLVLVSVHALFNNRPNLASYTLDYLAIFSEDKK